MGCITIDYGVSVAIHEFCRLILRLRVDSRYSFLTDRLNKFPQKSKFCCTIINREIVWASSSVV